MKQQDENREREWTSHHLHLYFCYVLSRPKPTFHYASFFLIVQFSFLRIVRREKQSPLVPHLLTSPAGFFPVACLSGFHSQGHHLEDSWWFATCLFSYSFSIWGVTYLASVYFSWSEWAVILIIPMYTVPLLSHCLLRFQFVCDLPGCCVLFLRIWALLWVRLFLPPEFVSHRAVHNTFALLVLCRLALNWLFSCLSLVVLQLQARASMLG